MAINVTTTINKYFKDPVKSALENINLAMLEESSCLQKTEATLALISAVVWADDTVSDEEKSLYKSYLSQNHNSRQIEEFEKILECNTHVDIEVSCKELDNLSATEKEKLIKSLFTLANTGSGRGERECTIISKIAKNLHISEITQQELQEDCLREQQLRTKVLQSGSGIFAALIILLLFGLTATFLKSVLFGLIFAYLFLPLQRFIENKVLPSSLARLCIEITIMPFQPIRWLGKKIKLTFRCKVSCNKQEPQSINKELACHITTILAVCSLTLIIGLISWLSVQKISGVGESTRNWINQNAGNYELESLKPKLESIPGFIEARNELRLYLNDKENQKKLALIFAGKSSGIIGSITSAASRLSSILLDGLLALFFFTFFLQKMATFKSTGTQWNPGEYLTESIFNTSWMPSTSTETKAEAKTILNDIFNKLHTWVKGYVSIIAIEIIIYTTIFIMLGIPYAVILGIIAGCTVLLPFVGPLASGLLTILVYVAVASSASSMTIIILIIITYAIMNAIIEQLILYPALIGEALGLNTLETIIVVLLGGLFAGLSGMIFAVPVASILKLITPKIYGCWQT